MEGQDDDKLNNSIDGEFTSDQDELNKSTASTSSEPDAEKKRRTQTPSPHRYPPAFVNVPASPPKFMSLDEIMAAAAGVKNMSLAHEIAVDANFKLEKLEPSGNSFEKKVKEVVHKAFWDAFQEKLNEDPPELGHAVVLIQEVKDLCSPARDDNIAKLKEIKDIIPLFQEIFAMLDLMKMDMANFTIQQIRPYLQQQSMEYEKTKFEEFLKTQRESGIDGLELTKIWLKKSFDALKDQAAEEGATSPAMLTPAAIVNEAYVSLLSWDENQLFPETLVMDQGRFTDVGDKIHSLTLLASILLVTYSTVGAPIAGLQKLKEKLKSEIMVILDGTEQKDLPSMMSNVAEQVNKNVNEYMSEHGFHPREETQQTALSGQITSLSTREHPVYKVMYKRIRDFILHIISQRHSAPLKVPPGFSVVETELGKICGQFLRLISHNRATFSSYYTDIANELMQIQMEDLSPRG
ncbi:Hypothetical predicted protein [Mytilus galloprovincialis]|uniref:T-complex protein 11-like protein 1 n=1 Tax=Mytilus galloprovincialis TaxID=29158 RepID=A0A8B6DJZ1_MYTGA|nr:Hypothetical predicted protein [Mytilus galloprovincialis]